MILFYSGASNYEDIQSDINLSLGQYISNTQVPNDVIGATFGSVSILKKSRNDKQVFLLVLKNTTGSDVTDILIHYDYPDPVEGGKYILELAFVNPTLDSDGNPVFEKIPSPNSLPLTGSFSEYNGITNQVNIGNLNSDQTIGVWFKSTLNQANNVNLTDQQLYDNFADNKNLDQQEQINFVINYT